MGFTDLIKIYNVPVPKLGHLGSVLYSSVFAVGMFRHRRTYDLIVQMRDRLDVLGAVAAGVAHEVRGPLGSIRGAARLLDAAAGGTLPPEGRAYLDVIRDEVVRLDGMLAAFQHLTRPPRIRTEALCVNDTVRKTVTLAEIAALPLEIAQELAPDLPSVQADASALKQVFLNLIKNAAEAGGGKGRLRIRTAADAGGVRITFTDNGPGLPQEGRDRIFEPFFSTKASGMGVGLAVTRGIVQAHGGRIEARDAAGGGAQFAVFLPARAA
jgi:signal transduction histidine kinase